MLGDLSFQPEKGINKTNKRVQFPSLKNHDMLMNKSREEIQIQGKQLIGLLVVMNKSPEQQKYQKVGEF